MDPGVGAALHRHCAELYPICRSITGDGVRATLRSVAARIPLELVEVPSGTPVLDWEVPPEWNVRDAYVADAAGRRVVDFQRSNLHLVGYSVPVRARMTLDELRPHLHSLPDRPEWVPYRTSYYSPRWGFCLADRELAAMADGDYEVVVDTTLEPGFLTYGECLLPGVVEDEILLTTHVCHPSLANDNLSGIAVLTRLGELLAERDRRHTFRLLFIPGTIGSITWLARNDARVGRVAHGIVVAGVGDPGPLTYKRSRRGDAAIDRAVAHVLAASGRPHGVVDFSPYGYDERQFCSPGYDLPVGHLGRTPFAQYPEYHTSADDLELIQPDALADALAVLGEIVDVLEGDTVYRNTSPKGEPQLGRRGLYATLGGDSESKARETALLWVLNQSDGRHSLLDVAERAGLPFATVRSAADALLEVGLLERAGGPSARG